MGAPPRRRSESFPLLAHILALALPRTSTFHAAFARTVAFFDQPWRAPAGAKNKKQQHRPLAGDRCFATCTCRISFLAEVDMRRASNTKKKRRTCAVPAMQR